MNSVKPTAQLPVTRSQVASMGPESPARSYNNIRSGSRSRLTASAASPGTMAKRRGSQLLPLMMIVVVNLALAFAILSALNRPDVYTSYSTGRCVKVIKANGSPGRCDSLPGTYNNHWVQ